MFSLSKIKITPLNGLAIIPEYRSPNTGQLKMLNHSCCTNCILMITWIFPMKVYLLKKFLYSHQSIRAALNSIFPILVYSGTPGNRNILYNHLLKGVNYGLENWLPQDAVHLLRLNGSASLTNIDWTIILLAIFDICIYTVGQDFTTKNVCKILD